MERNKRNTKTNSTLAVVDSVKNNFHMKKTLRIELNNYRHLLQVNENYLIVLKLERTEAMEKIDLPRLKRLKKEFFTTEKSIELYKKKIAEILPYIG
jgi:hypothetical protein